MATGLTSSFVLCADIEDAIGVNVEHHLRVTFKLIAAKAKRGYSSPAACVFVISQAPHQNKKENDEAGRTLICGTPRGAGGMPDSSNLPNKWLRRVRDRSPSKTWIRTPARTGNEQACSLCIMKNTLAGHGKQRGEDLNIYIVDLKTYIASKYVDGPQKVLVQLTCEASPPRRYAANH